MTQQEKQLMIDVWTWLYEHPLKTKKNLPQELLKLKRYHNHCVFCKYHNGRCSECDLYITSGERCFSSDDSWYNRWFNSSTPEESRKWSGKILEVCKNVQAQD